MAWFKSKSKYHAKKVNGYDSKKEAYRAAELKLLEQSGEISDLREQVVFELIPKQLDSEGKCIERSLKYKADFVYKDKEGNDVVEDVKGMRTTEYVIKRKLMLFLKGIRIKES